MNTLQIFFTKILPKACTGFKEYIEQYTESVSWTQWLKITGSFMQQQQ